MIVSDDADVMERIGHVLEGLCDVATGRSVDDALTSPPPRAAKAEAKTTAMRQSAPPSQASA